MKKNTILLILLGISLLVSIALVSIQLVNQEKIEPALSSEEQFTFKTVNGTTFNLKTEKKRMMIEGMENKIVFLKVFGWNCTFCMKEVPELIKLQESLSDKFTVLAIEAQNHSRDTSLKEIEKHGINYPIILGQDQDKFYRYLQEQYGWSGIIPLTIVLSEKGDVVAFELGKKSYSLSELFHASLDNKSEI